MEELDGERVLMLQFEDVVGRDGLGLLVGDGSPLPVPVKQDGRHVLFADVDEGVECDFGFQGRVLPLLLVHIQLHPRHQGNGVDPIDGCSWTVYLNGDVIVGVGSSSLAALLLLRAHDCLALLLIGFVALSHLVDVVLVLVLQFVDLEHGLDAGIASLGQNAQADVALVDEVVDRVSAQTTIHGYTLNQRLSVILQVDADEVLVLDEPPALLNASFHDPDLSLGQLQSPVGLQDVVLHCIFIRSLKGSHHKD